jgi:hypothetical protein
MIRKLEFCLKLAGGKDIFVHSDCDVQFFKPIREDVEKALEKADIAFQHDGKNYLCAGLLCAKPSEKLQVLFHSAIEMVKNGVANNDQTALNMILKSEDCLLTFDFMPNTWWTHGADTFNHWNGEELNPPQDIVAHHANWVEGVDKKISLLSHVMERVYNGKYKWSKAGAGCESLDNIYGASRERFILMPEGESGEMLLKKSKTLKSDIDECVRRGAM